MTVFVRLLNDGAVQVLARLEAPGAVGDISRILRPGESLLGYTCEEFRAMGAGAHQIESKDDLPA